MPNFVERFFDIYENCADFVATVDCCLYVLDDAENGRVFVGVFGSQIGSRRECGACRSIR